MQIHELNRPRRTDEGLMGAIGTALGQAVSPVATQASSAGILDPDQKLAAVMKNPAMVKLATQYADAWLKDPASQVPAAPASAPAAQQSAPPGETPEQKRIRLQKAAQQNIDKTAVPVPAKPAAPTPADIRQAKQAQAAQAAQAQMSAVKEDTAVATPGTYNKKTGAATLGGKTMTALSDLPPNVQKQIQAKQDLAQQTGRANPYMTPAAQQPAPVAQQTAAPAPVTNKTTPAAAQGFNATNVMKMPGMEKYAKPAPAPATKTANFGVGPQGYSNTATLVKTAPGQPAAKTAPGQPAAKTAPGQPAAKTAPAQQQPAPAQQQPAPVKATPAPAQQQQAPARDSEYLTKFLDFANERVAPRDSALGLADVKHPGSGLETQLDAAEQAVVKAQGNPAATKEAVKNYMLTAMAGIQLVASKNSIAGKQTTSNNIAGVLQSAGIDSGALSELGAKLQKLSGNKVLKTTGDATADDALKAMGYTVS
jgi:hypothetical protein